MEYKNHIIQINPDNIYNYPPAKYCYFHKDDTEGNVNWGVSIEHCKEQIDEEVY